MEGDADIYQGIIGLRPDANMNKSEQEKIGLYPKYRVHRVDGRDQADMKHEHCSYIVLDLDHDLFARVALMAYAAACKVRFPALSHDLSKIANYLNHGYEIPSRFRKLLRGSEGKRSKQPDTPR